MEIFRIRNNQLNVNQHVEYNFSVNTEENSTDVLDEYFQLKLSSASHAHLLIMKDLKALKEIDLEIQMKIFTNDFLTSISMMKLSIYLSQFHFNPWKKKSFVFLHEEKKRERESSFVWIVRVRLFL